MSDLSHHIKAIRPALRVMDQLGYDQEACLQGTDLSFDSLENSGKGITLAQELRFYHRLIELSDDPLLGLRLGKAYTMEAFGILGYAMSSAVNLADAFAIGVKFNFLTYTHFDAEFSMCDENACMVFKSTGKTKRQTFKSPLYTPEIIRLFCDRELSAVINSGSAVLKQDIKPTLIRTMHNGEPFRREYEAYFSCPFEFNCEQMEIYFQPEDMLRELPHRDSETSAICQLECQRLIDKLSKQSHYIDEVRRIILAQPGRFPNIDEVAKDLNCTARTLRRKLVMEGSSFRALLDEIRYTLAKDYLATRLSFEQIADLLGFSEAANFSHAFKRWAGESPKEYRIRHAKLNRE